MSSTPKLQELPPPGGYDPLNFARKPAKQFFRPGFIVLSYVVSSVVGAYFIRMGVKKFEQERIEERSSMMALLPMLLAERDRAYLKQLRRNRDEEAELMKNVDGWVVGTWYGEPCYKLNPPDTLLPYNHHEFFAHASPEAWFKWTDMRLWS